MKKILKSLVSLTAAGTMLLSTTAFAATTSTVTEYSAAGTTVTSTVSGLTQDSMVTYLAVAGQDQAVDSTGSNIVYIGQQTVGSSKSATFSYDITGDIGTGTYATVKYGSNVDAISDTNYITVGNVTVNIDGDAASATVTGDTTVGGGDETTLNIAAADGYEIINIKVGDVNYDAAQASAITAKAGDTVTVTTAATNADAVVYQLVGAKVDAEAVEGVYRNSGIVRVVGVVGSVDQVYFTFDGGKYDMNGEVEDGKFVVNDLNGNGYYGVEIEDINDVSTLSVEAHAVKDNAELTVVEIQ